MPPASETAAPRCESVVVIPARYGSTRLPGKMLLAETGKPLVQHTYEAARRARRPRSVCVATDDERIAAAVQAFGGLAFLTDPSLASGTDRVAQVMRQSALADVDIVVNVQGDEPELSADSIDLVVELMLSHPETPMATLATPIRRRELLDDPACVKMVFASTGSASNGAAIGRAVYFSRAAVPFARTWIPSLLTSDPPVYFQHLGLYAYRKEFLLRLSQMPPSPLERIEKLEQLRVLEAGHSILAGIVHEPVKGIDTPEDYRAFVARFRGEHACVAAAIPTPHSLAQPLVELPE